MAVGGSNECTGSLRVSSRAREVVLRPMLWWYGFSYFSNSHSNVEK